MAHPSDQSENAAASTDFSFTRAFAGDRRPNNPTSLINPNASVVSCGVKREKNIGDDFSTPFPPTGALAPHKTAHAPKRSFPLLGGWGRAAAAPAPPVAPAAPTEIVVGGVTLSFPFPPYPSQVCLSNQMIRAFKLRKHALLESPTGTGLFAFIPQHFNCRLIVTSNSPFFPQANRLPFCARALHGSCLKRSA